MRKIIYLSGCMSEVNWDLNGEIYACRGGGRAPCHVYVMRDDISLSKLYQDTNYRNDLINSGFKYVNSYIIINDGFVRKSSILIDLSIQSLNFFSDYMYDDDLIQCGDVYIENIFIKESSIDQRNITLYNYFFDGYEGCFYQYKIGLYVRGLYIDKYIIFENGFVHVRASSIESNLDLKNRIESLFGPPVLIDLSSDRNPPYCYVVPVENIDRIMVKKIYKNLLVDKCCFQDTGVFDEYVLDMHNFDYDLYSFLEKNNFIKMDFL